MMNLTGLMWINSTNLINMTILEMGYISTLRKIIYKSLNIHQFIKQIVPILEMSVILFLV